MQQGTLPTGTSQAQAQDLPNLPDQAQGPTTTGQPVPTTLPLNPTAIIQQGIMPLPPQAQYTSREALFKAIQA